MDVEVTKNNYSNLGQYFLLPTMFSANLKDNAQIVKEGLTPNELGIIEPSTTYRSS